MLKNALAGTEALWKVWWGLGIPTGAAMMLINVCVRYVVRLQTPNFYIMLLLGAQMVLIAAWVRTAWICAPNVTWTHWRRRSAGRRCLRGCARPMRRASYSPARC